MDDAPLTETGLVEPAMAALDGLDELAVPEHLAAFEEAHRALRAALEV
ncbi:hypothetical protein [Nocardioides sp. CFH 31398]|nr:hypothetical protein [Nocardioides sp. CFH 31398]MCH1867038.1 hypothetical protein [Nocardioides sp. CFH 31398]